MFDILIKITVVNLSDVLQLPCIIYLFNRWQHYYVVSKAMEAEYNTVIS